MARIRRILGMARIRADQGHLPVARQVMEMAVLWVVRGIRPTLYQHMWLFRRQVSFRVKLRHMGVKAYVKTINELNAPAARILGHNKLIGKALMESSGIPTPRFYGFLHPRRGRSRRGGPLRTGTELARLLEAVGAPSLCVKPLEGSGGEGFVKADVVSPHRLRLTLRLEEGEREVTTGQFVAEVLANAPDGVLVEECFEQDEWFAAFNPSSVNGVRVVVLERDDGRRVVVDGHARMGRAGVAVDNTRFTEPSGVGGLLAPVDLETGVLEAALMATRFGEPPHATHPDSGVQIAGQVLPKWQEIQDLAKEALAVFPHTRFAGFDIAVGPKGPVVLEINMFPGILGSIAVDRPTRDRVDATASNP